MGKKSKVVYIAGSIVIGIITVLGILAGLIFSGLLDSSVGRVVFSSFSAEKVYDGTPLTSSEWKLTSGTLKQGHTAEAVFTGEQTLAGSSNNTFDVHIYDANGADVTDEYHLIKYVTENAYAKSQYDKLATALAQAEETGYGVVPPSVDCMTLAEPEITKQGNRYGVKLKATAPSLHLLKIDVSTEVSPVMGTEQQSQYLLAEFQQNPTQIWQTNMFGKSMSNLVEDSLVEKCQKMPDQIKAKLVKTTSRIVNEGKGGMICLLL